MPANSTSKNRDTLPQLPFSSALVVGLSEDGTHVDRRFLAQTGVAEVRVTASIRTALSLLGKTAFEIILLDMRATNISWFMDALQRLYPQNMPPVVLISQDADEEAVLEAIGRGCSGVLLRPYSMKAFLAQMHRAHQGTSPQAMAVAASLSRRLRMHNSQALEDNAQPEDKAAEQEKEYSTAQADLEKGRQCLHLQSYQEAVAAFTRAAHCKDCAALAYLGLSQAWAGLEKINRADQFRYQAAEEALQNNNVDALEAIHQENTPGCAKATFVHVGFCFVKQGNTRMATQAFAQAAQYENSMEAVLPAVTRACYFTKNPPAMARKMASALADTCGQHSPAFYLQRIEGQRPYIAIGPEKQSSIKAVKAFSDVWAVLKYTCIAYTKGGFRQIAETDRDTGRTSLEY